MAVAAREGCSRRPDAMCVRAMSAASEKPTPSPGVTGPAERTEIANWSDGFTSEAEPALEPGCTATDHALSLKGARPRAQAAAEEEWGHHSRSS